MQGRGGSAAHPAIVRAQACAFALSVISDPSAQLNSGRQLSLLIEDGADRVGIGLGDDKHSQSMVVRTAAGKRDSSVCREHIWVLGLRREFFPASVITDLPRILRLLQQSRLSQAGVLFFLFGLGLRNRFRMR